MASGLTARLDAHFDRVTRARGALGAPQVLVRGANVEYGYGDQNTPFHAASIGKAVTATIVMQLVESGAIGLDDPLPKVLPATELEGLFVHDGVDRAPEATVGQLLAHTSGVADYFEGPVTEGPAFLRLVIDERDRTWTPAELLDFSRHHQVPVGAPGERFSYTDTGYVLLGRIIEEATGQQFHDVLRERIFEPLGMRHSWLVTRSRPADPATPELAPFWVDRVELSRFASISCDWACGGIGATPADLVAFSEALHGGRLLRPESLAYLATMQNRFRPGIRYGAGLMELRFEEFWFLLRGLPRPVGHIGILATHLFYDPRNDVHIAMNFGSTREMTRSFKSLIRIEQLLDRTAGPRGAR